jgi:hypothetical protein
MVGLFVAAAFALELPEPTEASPHWDLEVLYHEHKYDEGLELAKKQVAANPDDAELYWHICRYMYEKGETIPKTDKSFDKLAWYTEMLDWATKGLEKKPGDGHLLFAQGLANGRYGTTRGVLSSLFLADDVEDAWLGSIATGYTYRSMGDMEVLPCDVYTGLAVFYRLVPDSWVVDKIAGTRGDITKSLDFIQKSDECFGNRIAVVKERGLTEICYGQRMGDDTFVKAGLGTLGRGAGIPVEDAVDAIDKKHIAQLLADPDLACGYSRDGQQDLDEKKLAKQGEDASQPVQ